MAGRFPVGPADPPGLRIVVALACAEGRLGAGVRHEHGPGRCDCPSVLAAQPTWAAAIQDRRGAGLARR